MEKYQIIISDIAYGDMASIKCYIRDEIKDPDAAKGIIEKFFLQIGELSEMPKRHKLISDEVLFSSIGMRKVRVGNYYVFYRCNEVEGVVTVDRVLYCKREWENLL